MRSIFSALRVCVHAQQRSAQLRLVLQIFLTSTGGGNMENVFLFEPGFLL